MKYYVKYKISLHSWFDSDDSIRVTIKYRKENEKYRFLLNTIENTFYVLGEMSLDEIISKISEEKIIAMVKNKIKNEFEKKTDNQRLIEFVNENKGWKELEIIVENGGK